MPVQFWCVVAFFLFFFFKQKTAYELRISDWSSDVCSSDLFDELAGWPLPRVLLGDLNLSSPAVLTWSSAEGYQLVTGPPTHSTRQAAPTTRIDHVLVAGATVESAAVHDLPVIDHRAVSADLRSDRKSTRLNYNH